MMHHLALPHLLLGLLLGTAVNAAVVDWDNSPICRTNLPACQASCKAPMDYLFVCSAGSGPGGGPSVKCNCVTSAEPSNGNQRECTAKCNKLPNAAATGHMLLPLQDRPGRVMSKLDWE